MSIDPGLVLGQFDFSLSVIQPTIEQQSLAALRSEVVCKHGRKDLDRLPTTFDHNAELPARITSRPGSSPLERSHGAQRCAAVPD